MPDELIIYAIRDYESGKLLAVSTELPKPRVIVSMARKLARHVMVSSGKTKIFDSRWYLSNEKTSITASPI